MRPSHVELEETTRQAQELARELGLEPGQAARLVLLVVQRALRHELLGLARGRAAAGGPAAPEESLAQALARYEQLRQADPELTLRDFAEAEGLNYRSLVTRRQRDREQAE